MGGVVGSVVGGIVGSWAGEEGAKAIGLDDWAADTSGNLFKGVKGIFS